MQRIAQETIGHVIDSTDLVELIGAHITLRPAGGEFIGLCPFHSEKTPSFTVSPRKGFYHCFGCGVHGNAIGFLMAYDRLEFPEAVARLAEKAGIALESQPGNEISDQRQTLLTVLNEAACHYKQALLNAPHALAYLNQRGLTARQMEAYDLGYAPDQWEYLLKRMGSTNEQRLLLAQAGLIVQRSASSYDRFRDRLMFPIRDVRGQVVGFGGRILDKGEPKYLNSPESAIFSKGKHLYGLFEAQQRKSRHFKRLWLVEGYMDVLAMTACEAGDAVAALGTAINVDQLRRLLSLADEVVVCFDGDDAGMRAAIMIARRSLEVMRPGHNINFASLPEGNDPDSLLRTKGVAELHHYGEQAVPLERFLLGWMMRQAVGDGLAEQGLRFKLMEENLKATQDPVLRELLADKWAHAMGIPHGLSQKSRQVQAHGVFGTGRAFQRRKPEKCLTLTERAISMVLQYPSEIYPVAKSCLSQLDGSARSRNKAILSGLLRVVADGNMPKSAALWEYLRQKDRDLADSLAPFCMVELALGEDDPASTLLGLMEDLQKAENEDRVEHLIALARTKTLSQIEKMELLSLLTSIKEHAFKEQGSP